MKKNIYFSASFLLFFCFFVFSFMPTNAYARTTQGATDCTNQSVNCYMSKYGFYQPNPKGSIDAATLQRLGAMKTYAIQATTAFNQNTSYDIVEPQLILWWSYSEGIGGRTNYSNCANEGGNYFQSIENCDDPGFWQLGYGIQFGNIGYLKEAFTKMHGDPNNATLVQQVGQSVLDSDKANGTTPTCGGYSCTFPTETIDQIMQGVQCNQSGCPGNQETTDNWWASVLSRDPAINAYLNAIGLQVYHFNHKAVCGWVGNYCGNWQYESDTLGQVLNAWDSLSAGNSTGENYTATSNCVMTQIGNPNISPVYPPGCSPQTGNAIADYATQLAAAIKAHCPTINSPVAGDGLVTSGDEDCLDHITNSEVTSPVSPDPFAYVIKQLHTNTNEFGLLQCVGFAQAVAIGIGAPLPPGNIAQKLRQDEPGYKWYSKDSGVPQQVGDFMIWDNHIAVVTKVLSNGWYDVVEANGDNGSVGNDSYPLTDDPYGLALQYLGFMRRDPSVQ